MLILNLLPLKYAIYFIKHEQCSIWTFSERYETIFHTRSIRRFGFVPLPPINNYEKYKF